MTELEISFINIMIDETLAVLFQRKRWVRYPLCKRLFHYIRRKQAIFTAVICKLEYRQKALYGCWVAKEIDCFFFFLYSKCIPTPFYSLLYITNAGVSWNSISLTQFPPGSWMPFTVSHKYTHTMFVTQKRGKIHFFLWQQWTGMWDEADGKYCNDNRYSTVSHSSLCNETAMTTGG